MSGVYKILCRPTKEIYIGGTTLSFEKRFDDHRRLLRNHLSGCSRLQAAWNLHGEAAFEFRPLKEFPPEEVMDREQEAIRRLRPALNTPYRPKDHVRYWVGGGEVLRVVEIAERAGVSVPTIYARLAMGQIGEALLAPRYRAPRKPYARR